ncbi:hypothetical protein EKO23_07775 [Nocardioides guangzhouensis]|uniref:Uncharacterized protein n=1 Tax=Nocardioides guangzhouensis TaxID=2497878 RepID=A0A4Q4ZFG9_9ACTN|nr:hypothetical protein [Nocardioides guangzhouensis]RYP86863.1 hypothetical protein EKO23_07775 [Nocardioides guangzhouensis]
MPTRRRPLDRRTLRPRDYLVNPWQFGRTSDAAARTPAGGDDRSLAVAVVQHRVACLIRDRDDRHAARSVTDEFGFSKQYWSLCLGGEAWMGETMLAAAVSLILDYR